MAMNDIASVGGRRSSQDGADERSASKRRRLNPADLPVAPTSTAITQSSSKQYGDVAFSGSAQGHLGDVNVHHHHHHPSPSLFNTYEKLFNSLAFDGIDSRIRNVAAALPATCEWLRLHEKFSTWTSDRQTDTHSGILWIKGKAGSGKSTLMKEIVRWATQTRLSPIILSYFFDARSPHVLHKSTLGMYRTIVYQLLSVHCDVRERFESTFATKVRDERVTDWTVIELQNFLIQLTSTGQVPSIAIFVDALDEGNDDDVRKMKSFLARLIRDIPAGAPALRVCLSSRHYPHISTDGDLAIVIEEQQGHAEDIELYIHNELTGEEGFHMDHLRYELQRRSNGIFLWIVLVVPMLNKAYDEGKTTAAMTQKLQGIPPDLHDIFTQIISRDRTDFEECVTLFKWVLFSLRPLRPAELYHAVQQTCGLMQLGDESDLDERRMVRYLLHTSRGLVELTCSELEESVVRFIHTSVGDYLLGNSPITGGRLDLNTPSDPSRSLNYSNCNKEISELCLDYLLAVFQEKAPDPSGTHEGCTLCSYSSEFWWQHLMKSEGKENVVQLLLNAGADPNLCGTFGSPLALAASCGHTKIVQLLLEAKARIDVPEGRLGTALGVASEYGYENIVQMLLDASADPNDRGDNYDYPLFAALRAGHENTALLLLDKGADVNARSGSVSALRLATANIESCENIVRVILAAGGNVNALDYDHITALQNAVGNANEKIVRMLLDAGANVNALGAKGAALQIAVGNANEKIVRMLLDAGANVHVRGTWHMKPSNIETEKVIKKMLMDAGAVGIF